jgi:hypothetical protein
MTYDDFNAFCRALPATTYVNQWHGSHVWKVGGKVFAIGGWRETDPAFTFKVSAIGYEMLRQAVACYIRCGLTRGRRGRQASGSAARHRQNPCKRDRRPWPATPRQQP